MENKARSVLSSNASIVSSCLGAVRCLGGAGDCDGDAALEVVDVGVILILLPCAESLDERSSWSCDCCGVSPLPVPACDSSDCGRGFEEEVVAGDCVGEEADDDVDVDGPASFANLLLRI